MPGCARQYDRVTDKINILKRLADNEDGFFCSWNYNKEHNDYKRENIIWLQNLTDTRRKARSSEEVT